MSRPRYVNRGPVATTAGPPGRTTTGPGCGPTTAPGCGPTTGPWGATNTLGAGPPGCGGGRWPWPSCCSCAEARLGSTIVKTAAIASAPSLARDNMSGWPGGRRHWTTVHGDSKRDWCIYQTAAIYEIHRNAKPQRTACTWVSNSTHARRIREERCERLLRSYPALRRIHDAS